MADNTHQKTAVIGRLSSIPTISTPLDPFASIVRDETGTILMLVWSQLMTNYGGISSISKATFTMMMNCFCTTSRFTTVDLVVKLPLLLTRFILHRSDLAQLLVIVIGPPFSARRFLPALWTIFVEAAVVMDIMTTPLSSHTA